MAESRKGSDDESAIKVAPRKEGKAANGTIKLKRPAPKHKSPGNWKEGSVVDDDKNPTSASPRTIASPGPVVNQLDDNARETFATGRPLEDNPELANCKHCKKSFLKSVIKSHVDACLAARKEVLRKKKELKEGKEKAKKKEEGEKDKDKAKSKSKAIVDDDGDSKMEDEDEDAEADDSPEVPMKKPLAGLKSAKKKAETDGDKKGKKRKADGDAEKGPKQKKKKEEQKPKAPKPKGPVDVEKQCGVVTPNGALCARSLTCKSHSMGAKRAVPGRSLPYDMLLAAYQKKNQAKQQKAAIDANAPLEDEDEANGAPVDSDEETSNVMAALGHWKPQPFVPQPANILPIKRQYQLARLREQLDNATSGGAVNIFKVVSKNGARLPELDGDDAPGEPDFGIGPNQGSRRTSLAFGLQQPPSQTQRRQSQASRV